MHQTFQAIILGSDQGRKVYKKKLTNLVQRYRLNQKIPNLLIIVRKCL